MGRNPKWIESQPDDPVEDVVCRALESRLERLWTFLELAVDEPPSDTENVHHLRVFTRRTATAMELFADWLPRRRGRWVRKQVKRVRKAAGEARDLDVLRIDWNERLAPLPAGQQALLIEQVKRRRRKSQWPIEEAYQTLNEKNFERRAEKFIERVHWRGDQPGPCDQRMACFARRSLSGLLGPYLEAASAEMSDVEALHAFRIQSKQVRYAMEIFAGAFDDRFRQELYPLVATLQDHLGEINDHVTAQSYLARWRAETEAPAVLEALDAGSELEHAALVASHQAFLDWWTTDRREDLRRQFARYVDLDEGASGAIAEECA
jgi:CHAD domain-containing protein